MNQTKKLTLAGILTALAVVLSPFSIPIATARAFPIQHLVNIVGGILLGPFYNLAIAFSTSLIRNLMGTGTLLAFPGSMVGAFLAGYFYKKKKTIFSAFWGEVLGTGILGGLLSYPIALLLLGNQEAALFTFVGPFFLSSLVGAVLGLVLLRAFPLIKEKR